MKAKRYAAGEFYHEMRIAAGRAVEGDLEALRMLIIETAKKSDIADLWKEIMTTLTSVRPPLPLAAWQMIEEVEPDILASASGIDLMTLASNYSDIEVFRIFKDHALSASFNTSTCMLQAATNYDFKLVKKLLELGMPPDIESSNPLLAALTRTNWVDDMPKEDQAEVCIALLDAGASTDFLLEFPRLKSQMDDLNRLRFARKAAEDCAGSASVSPRVRL